MGLFRGRGRKKREKAAAGLLTEEITTPIAEVEVTPREVTGEARPDPDRPGWGRVIGQQLSQAREDRAGQV
jgi:hypothetical protein